MLVGGPADVDQRPLRIAQNRKLIDQLAMDQVRVEVGGNAQRRVGRDLRGEAVKQPMVGRHLRPTAGRLCRNSLPIGV